jgi:hypothetical protein
VLKSDYATLFRIPLAFFGVIYFFLAVCFTLFLAGPRLDDKEVSVGFWLFALIGLGSVGYFLYAEYMVGAICSMCTIVHLIVIATLPFAFKVVNIRAPTWRLTPASVLQLAWDLKMWVLFALLLVGTPILLATITAPPASVQYTEASLIDFGKCLKKNRVEIFVSEGCGYCKKQKALLGVGLEQMKQTDCGQDPHYCFSNKIRSYPAFLKRAKSGYVTDAVKVGLQSIPQLAAWATCPEPTPQ